MNIRPIKTSQEFLLPPPIYTSEIIAEATAKDGTLFRIMLGLSEGEVRHIRQYALDESDEALAMTSDRKRFGEGSYEDWYQKNRTPFALIHAKTGKVAAFAWFGPKPLGRKSMKYLSKEEQNEDEVKANSENWHTISYRSYGAFRGTGLMTPFVTYVTDFYANAIQGVKIWAIINADNPASAALARKIGFKSVGEENSDPAFLVMIRE